MLWLIVICICLVLEAMTTALICIWFCLGALFAFIAYCLNASLLVQSILFVLITLFSLILTKSLIKKYYNTPKREVNSIIGVDGVVIENINNIENSGQIKINGQVWTAKSIDNSIITKDTIVIVHKVEGVKAFVEEKK